MASMKKRLGADMVLKYHKSVGWFLLHVLLVFMLWNGGGHASPRNPFFEGLKVEGYDPVSSAVYDTENVFDYMNGEADVYFPFGFQSLYVLQWKKVLGGAQAIVEAYDMGTANGAQGIFDQYTQYGGEGIQGFGESAWSDKTIILFNRGRFFLRIWPDDSLGMTRSPDYKDLLELSRSIDGLMQSVNSS